MTDRTYTAVDMATAAAQGFRDGQQATVKDCLTVQPMAYAVFAANGNAVCFSTRRDHPSLVALEKEGHSVVSLAPIKQTAPQPEQSGWISVEDRMPEHGRHGAKVLCWRGGWSQPREMKWAANTAAKTEAGRQPRWEEARGCLALSAPTHWMPMPAAPALSAQGESHE